MPMVRPPYRSRPTTLYADGQECRSQCMSGEIGARLVRAWCELGASLELGGLLGTTGVVRGGGWSSYKVLACEQGRLPRSGRVRSVYVQSRGETATEMRDETRKCPAARRAGPCYGRIDSAN